jgi:hypothetical protein
LDAAKQKPGVPRSPLQLGAGLPKAQFEITGNGEDKGYFTLNEKILLSFVPSPIEIFDSGGRIGYFFYTLIWIAERQLPIRLFPVIFYKGVASWLR